MPLSTDPFDSSPLGHITHNPDLGDTLAHFVRRFADANGAQVPYPQMFSVDRDETARYTRTYTVLRLKCGTLYGIDDYDATRLTYGVVINMGLRLHPIDPSNPLYSGHKKFAIKRLLGLRLGHRMVSRMLGQSSAVVRPSARIREMQRVIYDRVNYGAARANLFASLGEAVRDAINALRSGAIDDTEDAVGQFGLIEKLQDMRDAYGDNLVEGILGRINAPLSENALAGGDTLVMGNCGHVHLESESHSVGRRYDSECVCESCFEEDYVEMHDGHYMHRDNVYHWDSDGEYHYDEESDDDDDDDDDSRYNSPDQRMDYSTNVMSHLSVDPAFKTTATGDFHMGVELETILRNDSRIGVDTKVREVRGELGADYLVAKYDGSLGNTKVSGEGIEWVTRPTSLATHLAKFGNWTTSAKGLVAWDAGCCGMHVHIDSKAFTRSSLGKLLQFFNKPDNATFIRAIAGRHPDTDEQARAYAKRDVQSEQVSDPIKALKAKADAGNERYCMINLTNLGRYESERLGASHSSGKYNTVELRIFRASMSKRRLLAQLEFTHAVIVFCRTASYSKLTGTDFRKWLAVPSNVSAYPRLAKFLDVQPHKHGTPLGAARNTPAVAAVVEVDELVAA